MYYTLKTTNTYRVPTVEDALRLREHLEKTCHGELTGFKYATKYIKAKGEIIEEGNHQTLLKKRGQYYKLYKLQYEEE
jgi:hypothetical protein